MARPRFLRTSFVVAAPLVAAVLALGHAALVGSLSPGTLRLAIATALAALAAAAAGRALGIRPGLASALVSGATVALWLPELTPPRDDDRFADAVALLGARLVAIAVEGLFAARAAPDAGHDRGRRLAVGAALALALVAPAPLVRAAALAAALALLIPAARASELPLGAVRLVLLAIVVLAVVAPVAIRRPEPLAAVLEVALALGLGAAWALAAGRRLELGRAAVAALPGAVAAAIVLGLDAAPLAGSITWKGDEDFHFFRLDVVRTDGYGFGGPTAFRCAAVATLALLALAPIARRWLGAARARLVPAAVVLALVALDLALEARALTWGKESLARYPVLELWGQALLAYAPAARSSPLDLWAEGWNRLLPLVSFLAATLAVARATPGRPWLGLLAALAFATVPSLRYFSTLLYLELPFVLLMLVVLEDLARQPWRDGLPAGPLAFLSLAAVPFLKETAVPFFALVAALGLGPLALAAARDPGRRAALVRAAVFYAVPLTFGVVYRKHEVRPFVPQLGTALDPATWLIFVRALGDQLGALAPLAVLGPVLAWRRGRRDLALALAGLFVGYALSMALDGPGCLFLARFMLVLVPPLVLAAREVVAAVAARSAPGAAALLALAIAAHVALSPVGLDGARRLYYGNTTHLSGELAYPFDAALDLVAAAPHHDTTEVLGLHHDYPFGRALEARALATRLRVRPFPAAALDEELGDRLIDRRPGDGLPKLAWLVRANLELALAGAPADAVIAVLPPGDTASDWPQAPPGFTRRAVALGECRLLVYTRD